MYSTCTFIQNVIIFDKAVVAGYNRLFQTLGHVMRILDRMYAVESDNHKRFFRSSDGRWYYFSTNLMAMGLRQTSQNDARTLERQFQKATNQTQRTNP